MGNDIEIRKKGTVTALLRIIAISMVLAVSFSGVVNAYTLNGETTINGDLEAPPGDTTLYVNGGNNVVQGPVSGFSSISLGEAIWGIPMLTANSINGNSLTLMLDGFALSNLSSNISVGDKSQFIVSTDSLPINNFAPIHKNHSYNEAITNGVTGDFELEGEIKKEQDESDHHLEINYTVNKNNANKLIFTGIEWKDNGPLIDHSTTMSNITFAGADVDTTNISFTNIKTLHANQKITLIKNFGDTVGTITGTKYTTSKGEGAGKVSLAGSDLIFTVETSIADNSDSVGTAPVNKYTLKTDVNTQPIVFTPGGNLTTTITTTNGEGDPFDLFRDAQLNGVTLTRGRHYTIQRGSLIIELLPEALKELPEGTNYLTVFFEDGDITIPFDMATVPKGNTKGAPKTGEI